MPKYKVKLIFKYSDIVYITAKNKKEAIAEALENCVEEYESFYDTEVTEVN